MAYSQLESFAPTPRQMKPELTQNEAKSDLILPTGLGGNTGDVLSGPPITTEMVGTTLIKAHIDMRDNNITIELLAGAVMNMQNFHFINLGTDTLTIRGSGTLKWSGAGDAGVPLLGVAYLRCENVTLDMSALTVNRHLSDGIHQKFENCTILPPSVGGGIRSVSSSAYLDVRDVVIRGLNTSDSGAALLSPALHWVGEGTVSNLQFRGAFNDYTSVPSIIMDTSATTTDKLTVVMITAKLTHGSSQIRLRHAHAVKCISDNVSIVAPELTSDLTHCSTHSGASITVGGRALHCITGTLTVSQPNVVVHHCEATTLVVANTTATIRGTRIGTLNIQTGTNHILDLCKVTAISAPTVPVSLITIGECIVGAWDVSGDFQSLKMHNTRCLGALTLRSPCTLLGVCVSGRVTLAAGSNNSILTDCRSFYTGAAPAVQVVAPGVTINGFDVRGITTVDDLIRLDAALTQDTAPVLSGIHILNSTISTMAPRLVELSSTETLAHRYFVKPWACPTVGLAEALSEGTSVDVYLPSAALYEGAEVLIVVVAATASADTTAGWIINGIERVFSGHNQTETAGTYNIISASANGSTLELRALKGEWIGYWHGNTALLNALNV